MGGWYLGSAGMALEGARLWRWSVAHALLIFVWSFGLLEGLLLIIHSDVLQPGALLGWPYILTLAVASGTAILGIVDLARTRPPMRPGGLPHPWWSRVLWVLFVAYVMILVVLLVDGIAPDGKVWPGPLSLLTARAFAAFFFALVLGAVANALARGFATVEAYLRPALVLATIIEIAAIVYIGQFDFAAKPGGLLYHASYVAAMGGAALLLAYGWLARRRSGQSVLDSRGRAS